MLNTFNNKIQYSDLHFTKRVDNLNPNWVTGLTDAEGSFIISTPNSTSANGKKVSLRFSLTQKAHSVGILYSLQQFFGCGQVIPSSKGCMRYVVQNKGDIINKIIPHFEQFPLQTSKGLNFNTFKEAAKIVGSGDHLNPQGLNKILSFKKGTNKNRSFSELYNYNTALASSNIKLHPFWVLGFIDGEGCFGSLITKSALGKIVTRSRLSVSQSTHDYAILKALKEFFNAGNTSPKETSVNTLEKALLCKDSSFYYNSSPETFIPFFDRYNLLTRKYLDYQDFKQFYQFKKDKLYLTESGFAEMRKLALNMNSGRNDISRTRRNSDNKP